MSGTGTLDDPEIARNFLRWSDRVTTSGRLTAEAAPLLAAEGIRHVVNLALDDHPEALAGEHELLAGHGIAYTHVPVPFDAPTHDHVAAMCEAIDRVDGPVHVHCIMNWRVTAFMYLRDVARGVPAGEARERMTKVWDPLSSDDPRARPWRNLLSP